MVVLLSSDYDKYYRINPDRGNNKRSNPSRMRTLLISHGEESMHSNGLEVRVSMKAPEIDILNHQGSCSHRRLPKLLDYA
jgi:hypothetical protein